MVQLLPFCILVSKYEVMRSEMNGTVLGSAQSSAEYLLHLSDSDSIHSGLRSQEWLAREK